MHALRVAPGTAVMLGLLVATGLTGCKPNSAPSSVAASTSQPATSAGSAPASPSPATSSATPGSVQNLPVSAGVRSELLTAFAAEKSIPISDVAGSTPGSVYYGYVPATDTYWAMASYEPASTDSQTVIVSFQDGGQQGFFKKVGSGPWQAALGGAPVTCYEVRFFPLAVLNAWSVPTSPSTC
ncbi:MAG: hypothetical protein ACRDP7_34575 [Trebonia sp.]